MQHNNKVKLSLFFDISSGMMDDGTSYFYLDEQEKKVNVKILRMAAFDPVKNEMKNAEAIDENERLIKERRRGKKGGQHIPPKEIEKNRLIECEDYVICSRRGTTDELFSGYSLLDSPVELTPEKLGPAVVSHNFIYLRPRKKDLEALGVTIHIPYLHLLLDVILKKISKSIHVKILKVSLLKEYHFRFPDLNLDKQINEAKNYRNAIGEKGKIERKIENINAMILDELQLS